MPVAGYLGGRRPGDPLAGDPLGHLRVADDVVGIVEVDEAVVDRRQPDRQDEEDERRAGTYQNSRCPPSSALLRSRRARRFSTASIQSGTKATRSRSTVSISESWAAMRRPKAAWHQMRSRTPCSFSGGEAPTAPLIPSTASRAAAWKSSSRRQRWGISKAWRSRISIS